MANLNRALQELRQERDNAEREVERLDEAISVVQGLVGRNHLGRTARPRRTGGHRVHSPCGRRAPLFDLGNALVLCSLLHIEATLLPTGIGLYC